MSFYGMIDLHFNNAVYAIILFIVNPESLDDL